MDTDGPRRLVLEAIDAASWDDIVVAHSSGSAEHRAFWQVKRQNTLLDSKGISKLFREMDAMLTGSGNADVFCFGTPHEVKLEFDDGEARSFRNLRDLCHAARRPGVNPARLATSGTRDEKAWCELVRGLISDQSDNGVTAFLSRLEIHELATEEEMRAHAIERLQSMYRNAGDLADRMLDHLVQTADGRYDVGYQVLQSEFLIPHGQRESTRAPWLRACRAKPWDSWNMTGPIGAGRAVTSTWPPSTTPAVVRVSATPQSIGDDAEIALLRLIAHRAQNVNAEVKGVEDWVRYLRTRSGGTLGFSADCRDLMLTPEPNTLRQVSSGTILPTQLAETLQATMEGRTWSALKEEMDATLAEPARLAMQIELRLLREIAQLWRVWEEQLEANEAVRIHFLRMCVATQEEWSRLEFDKSLRLGPRAVPAIAIGLFLALSIGTVLTTAGVAFAPTNQEGANLVLGAYTSHLIALAYASKSGSYFGLKITDAAAHFLPDELGCTMLAGTEVSADALQQTADGQAVPYHVPSASSADYQSSYLPKPVLTNDVRLRRALSSGLTAVRSYLAERFKEFEDAQWAFLRDAVEAPMQGSNDP